MDWAKHFDILKTSMEDMKTSAIETARSVSPQLEKDVRNMLGTIDKGINLDNPELIKTAMEQAAQILKTNEDIKG